MKKYYNLKDMLRITGEVQNSSERHNEVRRRKERNFTKL